MYTLGYYEYDRKGNLVAQGTFNTENKRYAWNEFKKSIAERFHGKDFWDDIRWNDIAIETVHTAEDGFNWCILHKWEGFEDDVSVTWKYGKTRYKSLEELWEAVPKFKDHFMETDSPFITNDEDKNLAVLDIEEKWTEQ